MLENSPDPEEALRGYVTEKIGEKGIEEFKKKKNLFKYDNAY